MNKRLPSLKKRPPSARRYIPPPSPMTAAIFQKSLTRKSAGKDFNRPTKTQEQFIDEVENYIQESLIQAKGDINQFKIYQEAFDILIQKYQIHSAEMLLVKNGYDRVINELMEKNHAGNKYRIMVQQSFTSLNNELQKKQAQFDKKKKKYADLISSVKSISSDLRSEIIELKKRISSEKVECQTSKNSANVKQAKLDHIIKKLDQLKKDEKEMSQWIRENKIRKVQLEEEAKQSQINLSDVLESISNSNIEIDRTHVSIVQILENIENAENQISKKNDFIANKIEEKKNISDQIISFNENSEKIQNENISLCRELASVLQSAGISPHDISIVGQDPVKLVALAVSKKRGYKNGIDPNLLES